MIFHNLFYYTYEVGYTRQAGSVKIHKLVRKNYAMTVRNIFNILTLGPPFDKKLWK